MTRINSVPPEELTREHLIAEYRELPRIFGLVRQAITRGEKPDLSAIPTYRLGTGHVRFFYPRLEWLYQRQHSLIEEMKRRGYQPQHDCSGLREGIPDSWFGDWTPCSNSLAINRARIADRLKGSKDA